MKQAAKLLFITALVGVTVFIALYSAAGFFDVLWRGSVLFHAVVAAVALGWLALAWRAWR